MLFKVSSIPPVVQDKIVYYYYIMQILQIASTLVGQRGLEKCRDSLHVE